MSPATGAQDGYSDPTRGDPDPRTRGQAALVARIILRSPGMSAAQIAAEANHLRRFDLAAGAGGPWRLDARLVRRLIWVARRWLGVPIIARPGGEGYRLCRMMGEAVAYAERCRRLGRDYFALAAVVLGRADLATGAQFSLDAIEMAVAPIAREWDERQRRLREQIGAGEQ